MSSPTPFYGVSTLTKIPLGILVRVDDNVNAKIIICVNKTNFERVSINDLLENIKIILDYILSKNKKKTR